MRRSLIRTVAAVTVIVLVALLVPMAVLVRKYALEDRLARAALEVQATETVVSGQDKGSVSVYLDMVNRNDNGIRTTVLYPDGTAIGPNPGEDALVREARQTGQARADTQGNNAQILIPVSLGGSSGLPANTPVIRVQVLGVGYLDEVRRSWALLGMLGFALLGGAVLVADSLGRSFVQPVLGLADRASRLATGDRSAPATREGPAEVAVVARALDTLVERVDELLERERVAVTDLQHRLRTPVTRLRLAVDGLPDAEERARVGEYIDALDRAVDEVIREARRSEREGLTAYTDLVEVAQQRAHFWGPLAEDQARSFSVDLPPEPAPVKAGRQDLEAMLDALFDNVFSHTPEGAALSLSVRSGPVVELEVSDDGPGFPAGLDPTVRGDSAAGSTGLGLDIVHRTARAAGGSVVIGAAPSGGASIVVRFPRA
jgi:signal transduction histidine kinase